MFKKIVKVALGILAVWVIIGIAIEAWDQWSRSDYAPANRPKKVTEFQNVRLGMQMDEVAYTLGYPESVYRIEKVEWDNGELMDVFVKIRDKELEKAKNGFKDYLIWTYVVDNSSVMIKFDETQKKVVSIRCTADEWRYMACRANQIQIGMDETSVIKKLGTPSGSSIDETFKTLRYDQWNMKIGLTKLKVVSIEVQDLSSAPSRALQ